MKFLDYIKGKRKGKNARQIEFEAMYDPFLDEAIEGYDSVQGDHAKIIAKLQGQVTKKSKKKSPWIIFSSVSSVAAIAILLIVFVVDNKSSQTMYASEQTVSDNAFFVYIPEEYVRQAQMAEISVDPVVEIDNVELLEPWAEIDIFVPEKHIELKKAKSSVKLIKTTTTISNLKEIMAPDEPIDIYVPEKYLKKRRQHLTDDGIVIRNGTF